MTKGFEENVARHTAFARTFEDKISPLIKRLDADRRALSRNTLNALWMVLFVSLALAVVTLVVVTSGNAGFALLPLIAGTIVAVLLVLRRQAVWERQVIDAIVPVFCSFFGRLQHIHQVDPLPYLIPFEQTGLVGPSNRRMLTHRFSGNYRGTEFDFVHASLYQKTAGRSRSRLAVFNGLLFQIRSPIAAPAPIVILPNFGTLRGLLERLAPPLSLQETMQPIAIADPTFEENFLLRAAIAGPQDENAVRAFVSPDFRAALVAVNDREGKLAYKRGALSAAFIDDMFYLALTRYRTRKFGPFRYERPRPFLTTRSFLRSTVDLEPTIHEMFDDISVAYRIIDLIHDGK